MSGNLYETENPEEEDRDSEEEEEQDRSAAFNAEIAKRIASTIQLHTKNKISEKNAFSLPLNSMFASTAGTHRGTTALGGSSLTSSSSSASSKENAISMNTFERASVLLEAGTTIYSKRVDSTLSTTWKVRENLFRTRKDGKRPLGTESSSEADHDAKNPSKSSKSLGIQSTIERKMSNITLPKERGECDEDRDGGEAGTSADAGPVFQKMRTFFGAGDSSAAGMLVNKLGVSDRGCFLSLGEFAIAGRSRRPAATKTDEIATEDDEIVAATSRATESRPAVVDVSALRRAVANMIPASSDGRSPALLPFSICPRLDPFYRYLKSAEPATTSVDEEDEEDEDDANFEAGDLDLAAEREEAALGFDMEDEEDGEEGNGDGEGHAFDAVMRAKGDVAFSLEDAVDDAVRSHDRHFDALESAIIRDMISGRGRAVAAGGPASSVSAAASDAPTRSAYDFFDRRWLRTNEAHWRRVRRQRLAETQRANDDGAKSASAAVATKKKNRRKKKKDPPFLFDFTRPLSDDEKRSCGILAPEGGGGEKKVVRTTLPAKSKDALNKTMRSLLRPTRRGTGEIISEADELVDMSRLSLNANLRVRRRLLPTSAAGTSPSPDNIGGGDDYLEGPAGDYDDDDDDADMTPGDGGAAFFVENEGASLHFLDDFVVSDLVEADHKVERQEIHYSTVAKRVDVGRLKRNIWTYVAAASEKRKTSSISSASKSLSSDETKPALATTFKDIVADLSSKTPENVTVPFYFITLLHNANEHNLLLGHGDRIDEAARSDDLIDGADVAPASLDDIDNFVVVSAQDATTWKKRDQTRASSS